MIADALNWVAANPEAAEEIALWVAWAASCFWFGALLADLTK